MSQFKKSYQKVKDILVSLNVKKEKNSQKSFLSYEYPSLLQELEPRFMFDGAAIETIDLADGISQDEQTYVLSAINDNDNAHATNSLLAAIEADSEGFVTDYSKFNEVVIIDSRVKDPHLLINSISRDAAIEVILNNQDGVDRIAEILQKYNNIDALHIVSHGDQSQLNLGNAILNQDNISDYSSQLHKWGLSLSEESNILFYGNNLGEGEGGKAFVEQIKELTDKNILINFDRFDISNESNSPLQLVSIDHITSEQIEVLDAAVNKVKVTFNELSNSEDFYRIIETAFMNGYNKDLLERLKSQWTSLDFSNLPEVKIISSNQILGGYYSLENIIYINKDLLISESATYRVLLEEMGHFIDQHINTVDSDGDEGAIFASLLLDAKVPKEYLNQLKYDNDNVLVTVDSKIFNIEAHQTHSNRVINVTENGSSSANFHHTLGVWYEPPGWVVIFKDRVVSSGTPSWVSWNNSSTWYNAGNLEYLNQGQTTSFTYQVWTEEWTQWFGSPVIFRSDQLSYYVTFNVTGENDTPVANSDSGSTTKNNIVYIDPLANDTDVDLNGTYANFSIVSATTPKGSVSINGKQIIFDPNSQFNYLLQGQSEVVNVSYTMSDQYGAQSSSTISITVNGVNVPPEAVTDVMITNEESSNTIDPTSNDLILDAGTGPLSVSSASSPKGVVGYIGNAVTFNPNGEFEYLSVGNSEIVSVSYTIADSRGLQDSSTIAVVVEGRNDAPVNNVTTPQSVQEDVLTAIIGLSVSDVDAGSSIISTTLSVSNGTLNASLAGGATISAGANNSANLTLSGTITQINAALATVQYQSNLHYNGADALTMLTDDGGNNGIGASLQDTDTVNITVTPVNDAPVNSVTTPQSVQEDVLTAIIGLSVSDVDAGSSIISTTLSVSNGTLNVSLAGGASISAGANNSANLTLSGTITQINAALATVQYQSNLHYNGADVLTMLTDDGGNTGSGGNLQDTDTVNITVTPVNDAPVNNVTTPQSVQEDVLTAIIGLSVSDVDAGSSIISTTLSVSNGTLNASLAGGASISAGANNSANLTLSGTITQINAALATVQYQSNLHYNGADVLTMLTDDGGNTGSGGNLQDTDTVNITVTPVNDAPVNSVTTPQSVQEDVLTAIIGLSVSDVDAGSSIISTTLSVSNGTLNVSLAGGASISAGANNSANLTLSGTITQINAALATVQYQSNLHYNGADVLTMLTDDGGNTGSGGNLQDTDTVNITVTPVNDAPVNNVTTPQSVQEDVLTAIIGLSVSDVDAGSSIISTTLSVSNGTLNASLAGGASISAGANNSANLTLSGTITQINAALATVQYQSNLHYNGADVLTMLTDDGGNTGSGGNLQDTDTVNITVTPVNDAPVNSVTTPQSVQEDVLTAIIGLSVSDVDAGSSIISTTLSVSNGTLNVSLAGGASISAGANNSANLTLSGTITQINAALATVQYQSNLHYNGADVLTMLTDDGGNTGSGGNLQDTDTVNITVTPVNDAPVNNVTTPQSVQEDVLTAIIGLSVSDVDAGSSIISTTLSVSNGTLNASLAGGASISAGANNSANLTLSGTITQINAALATVQYQSNLHYNGADVLTMLTDDGGNTGSGGNLQDTDTVNITVTPVNDAPVNSVTTPQSVQEDVLTAIIGLSVSDVDAGSSIISTTLSVSNGTLNVSLAGGASISAGANNSANLTLSGTITQINAALATVQYQSNLHYNGADVLTMLTDDGGNTGSGGNLQDTDTVNITVTPVNDAPTSINQVRDIFINETYNFQITDFPYFDVEDDTFHKIIIPNTVSKPTFQKISDALVNGSEVLAVDLINISYTPIYFEKGISYTSFNYQVNDGSLSSSVYSFSFNVLIVGDVNQNGVIDAGEVAGDVDKNGIINDLEIAGDLDGDGIIAPLYEVSGDLNGNGVIDLPDETAGDMNGNGLIDRPNEVSGDLNGNGVIDLPDETAGDINGNGLIDRPNEVSGDLNGNGVIDLPDETAGDINGNGLIDNPNEVSGDLNGSGGIDKPDEIHGDIDGDSINDNQLLIHAPNHQYIHYNEVNNRYFISEQTITSINSSKLYEENRILYSKDFSGSLLKTLLDENVDISVVAILISNTMNDSLYNNYDLEKTMKFITSEIKNHKLDNDDFMLIANHLITHVNQESHDMFIQQLKADSGINLEGISEKSLLKKILFRVTQNQDEEISEFNVNNHKYKIGLAKSKLMAMIENDSNTNHTIN